MQGTLNPDASIRVPAEKFINESKRRNGYCSVLLEISANTTISDSIKLAAAVELSKFVIKNWDENSKNHKLMISNRIPISDNDKQYVRANII
jgi:hypothetical protein